MKLIDADKFIEDAYPLEGVPLERIKNTPTVDAVPVVRCKDCKYFQYGDYCVENKMEHGHCHEDDFCSYGEREEKKS